MLYITIAGANGPSGLLFALFSRIETAAAAGLAALDAPAWLTSLLCAGMLRALGSVSYPHLDVYKRQVSGPSRLTTVKSSPAKMSRTLAKK